MVKMLEGILILLQLSN